MMANTHTIQPPRHTNIEYSETIRQKANMIIGMQEHNKQIHNEYTFTMRGSGQISRKLERLWYY